MPTTPGLQPGLPPTNPQRKQGTKKPTPTTPGLQPGLPPTNPQRKQGTKKPTPTTPGLQPGLPPTNPQRKQGTKKPMPTTPGLQPGLPPTNPQRKQGTKKPTPTMPGLQPGLPPTNPQRKQGTKKPTPTTPGLQPGLPPTNPQRKQGTKKPTPTTPGLQPGLPPTNPQRKQGTKKPTPTTPGLQPGLPPTNPQRKQGTKKPTPTMPGLQPGLPPTNPRRKQGTKKPTPTMPGLQPGLPPTNPQRKQGTKKPTPTTPGLQPGLPPTNPQRKQGTKKPTPTTPGLQPGLPPENNMKRMNRPVLFLFALALFAPTTHARDFFVAVDGDDTNVGTREEPLATLGRARDLARATAKTEPISVYLRAGTHRLDRPLVFSAEDSGTADAPVTFMAWPGEVVTLKGSLPVKAAWAIRGDGVWVVSLVGTSLEGRSFNQLFCNDQRMVRARYPNWDFDQPLRGGKGYLEVDNGGMDQLVWKQGDLDERATRWSRPTDGIVHAFHPRNWGNMQYRIGRVDPAKRRIEFSEGGWQCQRRLGPGRGRGHSSPYYVENILEELDAPAEWFLDTEQNVLYFRPPTGVDPSEMLVEAAVFDRLIEFRGDDSRPVHHVNLKGFRLTQSQATFLSTYEDLARGDWAIHRGGAIYFAGAEDCRVDDCHLEQLGGTGVFVDGYNRRVHIAGCLIEQTGESGVCFVGRPEAVREYQTWTTGHKSAEAMTDLEPGPKTSDYPAECSVSNTITRDVGVYGKQTSGVLVSMSMDITISHCTVYNIPRAGITFNDGTWGGHILEHCDIRETVQETGEHGPFNSWGRERFWTGLKRDMVMLDAMKTVHIRNNRIANFRKSISAGNWTIDLDDGSSNFHIYNNLSLGSTLKLRDGYFRTVYNNIHVSGVPLGWHCWPEDSGDEFHHNITVIAGGPTGADAQPQTNFLRPAGKMCSHPWGKRHSENVWWNVNTGKFHLAGMDFDAWRARGYGEGSVVADPLFVDPARGDYRVREDSPALKLGFKNFPMDQFGHRMTRIVPFGGEFEGEVSVEIRPDVRGGEIHYTLDGTDPTPDSPLYTRPPRIDATTKVTARTFRERLPVGFPASATFTRVAKVQHPSWLAMLLAGESTERTNASAGTRKAQRWLGATVRDIKNDPDLIDATGGQDYGVYIERLEPGGRLSKCGGVQADIIISYAGEPVEDLAALHRLEKKHAGKTVTIVVRRGYGNEELRVSGGSTEGVRE